MNIKFGFAIFPRGHSPGNESQVCVPSTRLGLKSYKGDIEVHPNADEQVVSV